MQTHASQDTTRQKEEIAESVSVIRCNF